MGNSRDRNYSESAGQFDPLVRSLGLCGECPVRWDLGVGRGHGKRKLKRRLDDFSLTHPQWITTDSLLAGEGGVAGRTPGSLWLKFNWSHSIVDGPGCCMTWQRMEDSRMRSWNQRLTLATVLPEAFHSGHHTRPHLSWGCPARIYLPCSPC